MALERGWTVTGTNDEDGVAQVIDSLLVTAAVGKLDFLGRRDPAGAEKISFQGDTLAGMRVLTRAGAMMAIVFAAAGVARAADASPLHVTLTNGFDLICDHRETVGERVRLYLAPGSESFVEVAGLEIASVEAAPAIPQKADATLKAKQVSVANPTAEEVRGMMSRAGVKHNVDVDLLASVVRAESGGNIRAVSRTGARGLMQLMPGTADGTGSRRQLPSRAKYQRRHRLPGCLAVALSRQYRAGTRRLQCGSGGCGSISWNSPLS